MKKYDRELGFGLAIASIFAALITWFIFSKPQNPLMIGIAVMIILIGMVTFVYRIVKKNRDLKMGVPAEDEFSKRAKIFAGNQAFEYSMYCGW
jgi:ABC-type uncharacterized transport system permease subunit